MSLTVPKSEVSKVGKVSEQFLVFTTELQQSSFQKHLHTMHKRKTQLQQLDIGDPLDANRVFNQEHGDNVPLVLVPSGRTWCSCFYHVPTGAHTIVHICGDDAYPEGLAPPGIQMCKPWYNHVAYMVTQQSCTYNAPVKSCPTKDNVMVDCELTLVFSIGPDHADVKNFGIFHLPRSVYELWYFPFAPISV